MHLVTLLCSMDTCPIATLEFIRLTGHQSFKTTHSSIRHTGLESFVWYLLDTYLWHCSSFAPSDSKCHRASAPSTKATEAAAASATVLLCPSATPDHPLCYWEKSPQTHKNQCRQWRFLSETQDSKQAAKLPSVEPFWGLQSVWEPGCFQLEVWSGTR